MVVGVGESHVDIDPNQCPCTTGRDSFDGMTLLELGNRQAVISARGPFAPENVEQTTRELLDYFERERRIRAAGWRLTTSDEDGHLEVDDWYRRNSEGAP
jgi:hypothetical protein